MADIGLIITRTVTAAGKRNTVQKMWKHKYLYLLGLPGILCFIIFKYVPMYGLLIAFQDFNVFKGILGSDWVGLKNFIELFKNPDFYMLFKNALTISFATYLMFPFSIILALLLNELRSDIYKRVVQNIIYLPHFVSWVLVTSLTYFLLSREVGLINKVIEMMGGERIAFLFEENMFLPMYLIQNLWKNIGWGSIIYMAAITGISTELYDAAKIDGAGRLKQIWHVTIPGILPTIIILQVLHIGNIMDVSFEHIWLMQNPLNISVTEVFETYVFKTGVKNGQYSMSTAIGIFKSLIGLGLILGANASSKKLGQEALW